MRSIGYGYGYGDGSTDGGGYGDRMGRRRGRRRRKSDKERKREAIHELLLWKTKPDHIHLLDVVGSLFVALCIAYWARLCFLVYFSSYMLWVCAVVVAVVSFSFIFFVVWFFSCLPFLVLSFSFCRWLGLQLHGNPSRFRVQVFVIWTDWNSNQFFGKKNALWPDQMCEMWLTFLEKNRLS